MEEKEQAFTSKVDDSHLWHKRFGHKSFHYEGDENMSKILENIIENMSKIIENINVCNVFQYGKQNIALFFYSNLETSRRFATHTQMFVDL